MIVKTARTGLGSRAGHDLTIDPSGQDLARQAASDDNVPVKSGQRDRQAFRIDGDLTIVGVTRPVMVAGQLTEGRVTGSAVIVQSQFGIRPYTAFLGALKLRDEVDVQFDIDLASAAEATS